jgi:hypothetical protein
MRIIANDEPTNITDELQLSLAGRYAVQNRDGNHSVYLGWSEEDADDETGLELPAGVVYELPASLSSAGGQLWAVTDGPDVDIRIFRVG